MKKILSYFSGFEIALWAFSVVLITLSFFIFDGEGYFSFIASLIGATSLIFYAKGNLVGHVIGIVFCILYAIISYSFAYYGELLTFILMNLPMSISALVSWSKNPYKEGKIEVKISEVSKKEAFIMVIPTILVTVIFYFILKHFGTANLLPSTISVATSFAAVYLSYRRSPYYAIAYAANDLVLAVLWILACTVDRRYVSVLVCFITFFFNDIYGFINWKRMKKRQEAGE